MPITPKIPFTQLAYAEMKSEEARLKHELKEVMERLKVAREMGDLSENGAYKYAKFEIGSIKRQLRQLNYLLTNGQVFSPNLKTDQARFGNTVKVLTSSSPKPFSFMLVSTHEADPLNGKLSTESPIGKALLNKQAGDSFEVQTPKGIVRYTLLEIC